MLKEIIEAIKLSNNKTEKIIGELENVAGAKFKVEVEFYGGEGLDPLFTIEPIPDEATIKKSEELLKKRFKSNLVRVRENNGYVAFRIL